MTPSPAANRSQLLPLHLSKITPAALMPPVKLLHPIRLAPALSGVVRPLSSGWWR